MIGDALRARIETYAASSKERNALFTSAAKGTMTAEHVTLYLANVRALVAHTPLHLARAREAATIRKDYALAAHYDERIREEDGHEAWAVEDLAKVSQRAKNGRTDVLPSMRGMLEYIESVIDEDPTLYLAYIMFAEYLIVLVGPDWLDVLEERCGIPRSAMTVIAKHAELDKTHVQEALDKIDDLVAAPEKLPALRRVLEGSIAQFDRFCEELVNTPMGTSHVAPSARRIAAHATPS